MDFRTKDVLQIAKDVQIGGRDPKTCVFLLVSPQLHSTAKQRIVKNNKQVEISNFLNIFFYQRQGCQILIKNFLWHRRNFYFPEWGAHPLSPGCGEQTPKPEIHMGHPGGGVAKIQNVPSLFLGRRSFESTPPFCFTITFSDGAQFWKIFILLFFTDIFVIFFAFNVGVDTDSNGLGNCISFSPDLCVFCAQNCVGYSSTIGATVFQPYLYKLLCLTFWPLLRPPPRHYILQISGFVCFVCHPQTTTPCHVSMPSMWYCHQPGCIAVYVPC